MSQLTVYVTNSPLYVAIKKISSLTLYVTPKSKTDTKCHNIEVTHILQQLQDWSYLSYPLNDIMRSYILFVWIKSKKYLFRNETNIFFEVKREKK